MYETVSSQISSELTAMKKYNEMFNTETFQLDWERVYSLPFKITVDTKWREFQYKILHRICYTNVTFKFGLAESPLRYFCNEELETLEHFLFHFERFNTFWNELNTILNPRTYKQIHTPTVVQGGGGGWMEPFPRVFDILQYFETILPLV